VVLARTGADAPPTVAVNGVPGVSEVTVSSSAAPPFAAVRIAANVGLALIAATIASRTWVAVRPAPALSSMVTVVPPIVKVAV